MDYFAYLVLGIFAGMSAGLLGVGGGIIVVPVLVLLFQHQQWAPTLVMRMAIGTSLAIMIFTALSSTYAYHKEKLIVWPLFLKFSPGLLLGTVVGSIIAKQLSTANLRTAFAVFMILVSIKMFFPKNAVSQKLPATLLLIIASFVIGIISGLFGVGGGILMVPFFVYCCIAMHQATGTSAACGLPVAVVGTLAFMITGWKTAALYHAPWGATGYVFWPAALLVALTSIFFAPLGTHWAIRLHPLILKRVFAGLLILTAINLLLG